MNLNIKKISLFTAAALLTMALAGCGASVGVDYSGDNSPPPPAPIATSYYDFNYLQTVNGSPVGQANIIDYSGFDGGSVTFGPPGAQVTSDFASDQNGNDYWGNSVLAALEFDSNPIDSYVPAVSMVCNSVPHSGVGPQNQTSTDVLVTTTATQIVSSTQLAGMSFGQYYENCQQGGTIPETASGDALTFNADGSATIATANGGSQVNATVTLTAAQVSSALQGTPVQIGGGAFGAYTTLTAYKYATASGALSYAIVEHGSSTPNNLTGGYVAIWYP